MMSDVGLVMLKRSGKGVFRRREEGSGRRSRSWETS